MSFLVFLQKELREIIKTKKIYILPVVLLIFGIISPVSTRYMGEIIKMAIGDVELPQELIGQQNALTAFSEFMSNITQIGMVVAVFIFMGMVVEERVKGSVVLVLTKSLTRTEFILGKYVAGIILYTFSMLLASAASIFYTWYLFEDFRPDGLVFAFFSLWLCGVFVVSLMLLSSVISRSFVMAGALGFIAFISASIFSMIPKIGKFSPMSLGSSGLAVISGQQTMNDAWISVVSCCTIIVILVSTSVIIFKKQEI